MEEKGVISVSSENIFPVIKKFLYSDCDVFLRELVSNAVDASQKLKQLSTMGKYEGNVENLRIDVKLDKEHKKITISDQGIGMDIEEVKKYINQLAFSGATDFVNKYKDQGDSKQLIGFFGLGFYSAFMVSERVDILTRSYKEDAKSVFWTCDGSTSFEIREGGKEKVGTEVVLHVNQEEYLDNYRIKTLLDRFCKFLPVPIFFEDKQINNPAPLWIKHPQDLKKEDYEKFYNELFPYYDKPLFWIHLNIDYPFNLTGILYFPSDLNAMDYNKQNKIHLYARQVFITEEVNEIVPNFLMMLHGIIDSPDIPLNVSRSALQSDRNVKTISSYITKKVADKMFDMFRVDREKFEGNWDKIESLVKYGMLTEEKFYDIAKNFLLLTNFENKFFTFQEYIDKVKEKQTDKDSKTVLLYATDPQQQDMFIQNCLNVDYDVLLMRGQLDNHIVSFMENKFENINFKSVESATVKELIDKGLGDVGGDLTENEQDKLKEIFEEHVGKDHIKWSLRALGTEDLPVVVTISEMVKRMKDLEKWNHTSYNLPAEYNAVINTAHPSVKNILKDENKEEVGKKVNMLYQIGLLAQGKLQGKNLTDFINFLVKA
ncbi:MAG: molecular chaperone HtpG [Cytophagales bacterium]|jgi:molecular chaperone HtpG|nr:molecular chaperone HtpG [Cytophagales bacterium]